MSKNQTRQYLRAEAIRRRDNIPPAVRAELSTQVTQRTIEWIQQHSIEVVMLYLSMRSEVETDGVLDYLLSAGKIALAPIVDMKRHLLTPHRIENSTAALIRHPYGMREPNPKTCPAFPLDQLELVLVPGAAFDSRGYRIGYGGGFYDRFLPKCPQATWIGLAFGAQMIEDTFPEAWDVALHQVLTEVGAVLKKAESP